MKKIFCLFFALTTGFMMRVQGANAEFYCTFDASTGKLTMYYDDQASSRTGVTYNYKDYDLQTKVIELDGSMSKYQPESMASMFSGFKNLEEIKKPGNLNGSKVTNMQGMFRDCEKLKQIDIRALNTSKVQNMSFMFARCLSLESLNIRDFNTENVEDMQGMFMYCEKLTQIPTNQLNTSNVTNMTSMFNHCSSLTSFDFSHLNTDKVTKMAMMFSDCYALKHVNFGLANTSHVEDMKGMFGYCSSLEELDLTNLSVKSVTNLKEMFRGCSKLKLFIAIKTGMKIRSCRTQSACSTSVLRLAVDTELCTMRVRSMPITRVLMA